MGCEESVRDIAYIVEGSGPDGQAQWGIDDLQEPIRITLANYLSCITSNEPGRNDYAIPGGYEEGSYRDSQGNPAAITTGGPYPSTAYSTESSLDQYSNPFLDALAENIRVSDYLEKGRGDRVLQDIVGSSVDTTGKATHSDGKLPVERQVSQVLRNNRFNPTRGRSPFITGDQAPSPSLIVPTEKSLGAYRDPVTGEVLGTAVPVETMQKIALSLMLKATGDDKDGSLDPSSSAKALLPTSVQIGTSRLDPTELEARRAYGVNELDRVVLDSDFPRTPSNDGKSYGQLNSFVEPFGGFLPLGMISLAASTSAILIAGSSLIFGLLSLINDDPVTTAPGPYVLGQHGPPEAQSIFGATLSRRTLGLAITENSYPDSVFRGIRVFFGLEGDDFKESALGGAVNLLTAPGYYAITSRNILRSFNTISNALQSIDFTNPVEGVQAILGLVDIIKSSKIVAFFNILAMMGDAALRFEAQGFNVANGERVDTINSLPDSAPTRVMKSRSRDGSSKLSLAWRSSSTPSTFILPSSLALASDLYSGKSQVLTNITCGTLGTQKRPDGESSFTPPTSGRISPEITEQIENALDAEYVPFYFHDLRTNEIISFHAFLASLTDDYTVDYETIDAYGRVDPVKVYMKTTRQIAMSFHIAATNRNDFDIMWWKINKLITLLYPQWSQGTVIETGSGTQFVQPFSQIPTASPMIRLRIGDVIRSNYSKFNLARVFGLGQKDMIVSNTTGRDYISIIDSVQVLIDRMSGDPDVDSSNGYNVSEYANIVPSDKKYRVNTGPGGLFSSGTRRVKIQQEYRVKIVKRATENTDDGSKTMYVVEIADPSHSESGTQLVCTHADLRINVDEVYNKALANTLSNDTTGDYETVQGFFSSEEGGNPVVRAFESARGRGLAGVIESLNFDWYEPDWETDPGARAPKWCKVDLSFAPIHDIPPGLDADGFNRAPVYPVGATLDAMGDVYDGNVKDLVKSKILEVENALKETS